MHRIDDGTFDLTAFKASLNDNGLNPPNVDMDRHGAIGRFRMCTGFDAPAPRIKG